MSKKVTIRDIAKEANVSVATVSYVLNDRKDQAISEATRKKVLQIVNLHGYKINFSAKCLSQGKSNIVALYVGQNNGNLHRAEYMLWANSLATFLHTKGYSVRLVTHNVLEKLDNCDAIVCCDTTEALFAEIGEANLCPLVALNMCIQNHWLFYQINSDLIKIKQQADVQFDGNYTVAILAPNNLSFEQKMTQTFDNVVFVADYKDADQLPKDNLVVLGETLGTYCKRFAKNAMVVNLLNQQKLEMLFTCIDITVNRKESINHDIAL